MKHGHVDATLLSSERIAPFAALADPDPEPLDGPTRMPCVWDDRFGLKEFPDILSALRAEMESCAPRAAAE